MLFSLLFLSSTINFSAGLFFGVIGLVLSSLYHLPELIKYKNNQSRYIKMIRNQEKEVRKIERIRNQKTQEIIEMFQKVVEKFPYADRQALPSKKDRFAYMTNTDALTKLKEWREQATYVENVLNTSLSRFEEQTFNYCHIVLSDNLDQERIHACIQQSNVPSAYKEVLTSPNSLYSYSNKLKEVKAALEEDYRRLKKGLDGENTVFQEVNKYKADYLSLFGNRIDTGAEGTVENDVLIFSEKGIYTIEVKNIKSEGNQFLKISKDGIWYTRSSTETEWRPDENSTKIIDQVNRHVYLSQQFLLKHTQERIPVRPIIVISNGNVTIENETTWVIVRPNQIYSIIQQGTDVMDEALVRECHDLFARSNMGEAKFKVRDYGLAINKVVKNIRFVDECTELLSEINFDHINQQAVGN